MHLTLAGGHLWRKLMSICEHKRAPVEHIILFFPSGDLVSEVWVDMSVEKRFRRCVDPCQRCLTLDHTRDLCVMCLGEEHARSVLEGMECVHCEHFFCGKKLRSRSSAPRGSGPAAAEAVERLGSQRSAADESELRGKMYCLLHLLIQQEVLCWLMVCGGYFWAFSACLPRDIELREVMKRALLLGIPAVEARKRGSGSQ